MTQSTNNLTTTWDTFPCVLDQRPVSRVAIGLIALASDTVSEPELYTFLPDEGVGLYTNRIPMPKVVTMDSLRQMESNLSVTVEDLVPDDELDVVAYGCTSGTISIGAEQVAAHIHAVKPEVACTDPITAGMKGLRALGCQRIALLTPYIDEVNAVVEAYITEHGFEIVTKGSFKQVGDPEICRIPPSAIYDAALSFAEADIDGVFLSCTGLRTSSILEPLEEALGKPVVSSNQALAWDALRLAGYNEPIEGYGQLLTI